MLTGFMGAGKSTLGAILAAELRWRFVDTDEELVSTHGSSIAALFEQHGEAGFRVLEEQMVAGLMFADRTVIALGGGALESPGARKSLFASVGTHVIFLETPLAMALARCKDQAGGSARPVLRDESGLSERFTRRLEHYRRAHTTVQTVERTPGELSRLVLETLRPRLAE